MQTCTYVCMHACMHACMQYTLKSCMQICMYACVYVCMHACVHTNPACMHASDDWGILYDGWISYYFRLCLVKSTVAYKEGRYSEYDEIEMLQMIGASSSFVVSNKVHSMSK